MKTIKATDTGVDYEPLLLPHEAAERLRVSIRTLARWADQGKIRAGRTPSGKRRYFASEIDALAQHNPQAPHGQNAPAMAEGPAAGIQSSQLPGSKDGCRARGSRPRFPRPAQVRSSPAACLAAPQTPPGTQSGQPVPSACPVATTSGRWRHEGRRHVGLTIGQGKRKGVPA